MPQHSTPPLPPPISLPLSLDFSRRRAAPPTGPTPSSAPAAPRWASASCRGRATSARSTTGGGRRTRSPSRSSCAETPHIVPGGKHALSQPCFRSLLYALAVPLFSQPPSSPTQRARKQDRDKQKRKTISTVRLEQDLALKAELEAALLSKPFKAKPVPRSTQERNPEHPTSTLLWDKMRCVWDAGADEGRRAALLSLMLARCLFVFAALSALLRVRLSPRSFSRAQSDNFSLLSFTTSHQTQSTHQSPPNQFPINSLSLSRSAEAEMLSEQRRSEAKARLEADQRPFSFYQRQVVRCCCAGVVLCAVLCRVALGVPPVFWCALSGAALCGCVALRLRLRLCYRASKPPALPCSGLRAASLFHAHSRAAPSAVPFTPLATGGGEDERDEAEAAAGGARARARALAGKPDHREMCCTRPFCGVVFLTPALDRH